MPSRLSGAAVHPHIWHKTPLPQLTKLHHGVGNLTAPQRHKRLEQPAANKTIALLAFFCQRLE